MGKFRVFVAFLLIAGLLAATSSACLAADQQAKMTVRVDIGDKYFWTYPYITSDGRIRKPAAVVVEWSVGVTPKVIREKVIVADKLGGDLPITTEKGAIVNIQVYVVDAANNSLGAGSMQLKNTGQVAKFYVSLPEVTSPVINFDTGRAD